MTWWNPCLDLSFPFLCPDAVSLTALVTPTHSCCSQHKNVHEVICLFLRSPSLLHSPFFYFFIPASSLLFLPLSFLAPYYSTPLPSTLLFTSLAYLLRYFPLPYSYLPFSPLLSSSVLFTPLPLHFSHFSSLLFTLLHLSNLHFSYFSPLLTFSLPFF